MEALLPHLDFWSLSAASLMEEPWIIWICGRPGSGKTTLAKALAKLVDEKGLLVKTLDGDELRSGINSDLGFSMEDRNENLRRAAEIARLFSQSGAFTICSFITPLQAQRIAVKHSLNGVKVLMVGLEASIDTCKKRDPKGFYKRAENGQLSNFTGIQSPFEPFVDMDLVLDTEDFDLPATLSQLVGYINGQSILA
jgi:adenylyl-sulfate kinase